MYKSNAGRPITLVLDCSTIERATSTDGAKIIKFADIKRYVDEGYTIIGLSKELGIPYTTFHSFLKREGVIDMFTRDKGTKSRNCSTCDYHTVINGELFCEEWDSFTCDTLSCPTHSDYGEM